MFISLLVYFLDLLIGNISYAILAGIYIPIVQTVPTMHYEKNIFGGMNK